MDIFKVDAQPWAARDDGGGLWLYDHEPGKRKDGMFHCIKGDCDILPDEILAEIKPGEKQRVRIPIEVVK